MTFQSGRDRDTTPIAVFLYASLIVAAEFAIRFLGPTAGVVVHAVALLALASHLAFVSSARDPLLPALALLPVVRLVGIALSGEQSSAIALWPLITFPVLTAIAILVRTLRVTLDDLGIKPVPSRWWQYLTPIVGVPFGVALRLGVGSDARLALDSSGPIVVAIAVVSVVILEELLFRGLLQHEFGRFGQPAAVFATSALYAAMYLNAGPSSGAAVMAAAGLVFSWLRWRTGSLYGVVGAHVVLRVIVEA